MGGVIEWVGGFQNGWVQVQITKNCPWLPIGCP